ncbi:hypothetical protein DPMN_040413 [Dreissena polymorpha]|uniref:Uncharacterized protein n=1 Tax=Dreissena polymorpha TaxID=45954 RepID=A0A9D4HV64_DREPO|nr:hypothetical protein DPMN_040413 [Dreissena polymorpha]
MTLKQLINVTQQVNTHINRSLLLRLFLQQMGVTAPEFPSLSTSDTTIHRASTTETVWSAKKTY